MEEEYKFICEEDKEKVINVLENKKALLSQWIDTINEFEYAVEHDEDADSYLIDWQMDDEDKYGYAYIIGCVDENANGISVFPKFRGQITLHKYADGSWG